MLFRSQDQFGGPNNKKFMRKRLRQWLVEHHHLPMETQRKGLASNIEQWMDHLPASREGEKEGQKEEEKDQEGEEVIRQMDDMLVIGVRLTDVIE